ncbi:FKBP-type peptidyl-prolyl cis-trans isomerase SlpA [Aeromonas sp. RU39B]|jgi:FKBP-type peptidyl-prolyl cis-trans isomerase SlpA|uniref:FKBP-type peptidyl-prolyl cis-trans isomerase n=1 Tax=Aeromonas sp. RU39B TaxID=1907416 RepID=UPI000953ED4C|nr:FKBP-type peptidyl-prolyl cis-trans isomerase [Aeromonas sp. RU39B]SIR24243.1 FKBP-type peptidyl-prolyl cis-trans isomerase SlpA [Aeromonas sp. RU39B]
MSKLIAGDSTVLFHFAITLEDGSLADSTRLGGQPARLVMGDGSLTPHFEACLLGLQQGDKRTFTLTPEQAFGQPNPDNIHHLDRAKFGADAEPEVGAIIAFTVPGGGEIPGIVREVEGMSVTVDFNHPLAGHTVTFEVEILAVDEEA